jgi:type II secretory pathway component PulF
MASLRYSLLCVLSVAHTDRLELGPLIQCLASEHVGAYSRRLRQLSKRLRQGTSLVSAIEQTPDVLSDDEVLAIRLATQSGTLTETYQFLLDSQRPHVESVAKWRSMKSYWLLLLIAIGLIVAYQMIRIAPVFQKMAKELNLDSPTTFGAMHSIVSFIGDNSILTLSVVILAAYLLFSSWTRRFVRRVVSPVFGASSARVPPIFVLRLLAISSKAGRPLTGTLSTLAKYHYDRNLRQRFLLARNEVEQGVEGWQSLADAGLLSGCQANALISAPDNATRAWLLESLSAEKELVLRRRTAVLLALMQPVAMVAFGAIVLFVFVSFYGFNLHLIQSGSGEGP